MTNHTHTQSPPAAQWRRPVMWGLVIALIAAVYIGFAVGDGRPLTVEIAAGVNFH